MEENKAKCLTNNKLFKPMIDKHHFVINKKFAKKVKFIAKQLLPPIIIAGLSHLLRRKANKSIEKNKVIEWEYMPEGWYVQDPKIKGWNVQNIAEAQKERWPIFVHSIEGTKPLGITHENPNPASLSYVAHNTIMCFAYSLAFAARKKDSLKILDWGGGMGHYYPISKALLPDLSIEYHCFDTPLLCKYGRECNPGVYFHENQDDVFKNQYDFILVSSSLQYFKNYQEVLYKLATTCREFLYITRLPIVHIVPSFVVIQRPYWCYNTEFLSWYFNRSEFLKCAEETGLELIREFLIDDKPLVHNAPEKGEIAGFLFRSHKY